MCDFSRRFGQQRDDPAGEQTRSDFNDFLLVSSDKEPGAPMNPVEATGPGHRSQAKPLSREWWER